MDFQQIINHWTAHLATHNEYFAGFDCTIKIVVDDPQGGSWIFNCRNPVGVRKSEGIADCVAVLTGAALREIVENGANPQELYSQGEIKVSGEYEAILRLNEILQIPGAQE